MWQLCSGKDAAAASHQSRQLLSQLSIGTGFFLKPSSWSKRGTGRPRHPDMPAGWYASISHKHGRIVAVLADCPVGIDLEDWQPRHASRLNDLIRLLPEPVIQQQIKQSVDPQRSFYKAYTLHEALYKLASAYAQPVEGLFETRIADIRPSGKWFAWQWEDAQWSLSIVTTQDRGVIDLPLLPTLSEPLGRRSGPEALSGGQFDTDEKKLTASDIDPVCQIALTVEDRNSYLTEQFTESPAIRPLFIEPV